MALPTDIKIKDTTLYFIPVTFRIPLKFGNETSTTVTCARVSVTVEDSEGRYHTGWGETPLSVPWIWPSQISYNIRHKTVLDFSRKLTETWKMFKLSGHPIELGYSFIEQELPAFLDSFNRETTHEEEMPWLAALVAFSPFDIAVHDAYGRLHNIPVYHSYNSKYMNYDLDYYLEPAKDSKIDFAGLYPEDFFSKEPREKMVAWHLVGGKDILTSEELQGNETKDEYPTVLTEWINRDGLKCLKIKLRGHDAEWDYQRLVKVGRIAYEQGVLWLSADFNCTVQTPAYVNEILDRLQRDNPRISAMLLYVEQPFPYDLQDNQIDVRSVSARKPLVMDESAHDWKLVRLGRSLGWTGVALKTCKTQSGALLSMSWAKAHGMTLMVQ
ncbi:MAG: hypothetical protein ACLFMZ_10825, partial [Spirochaetaceae bacterium]